MKLRSVFDRTDPPETPRLSAAQEAAIAKLAYAAEQAGAIALLCGPAGVGKTMVLRRIVAAGMPPARTIRFSAGTATGLPRDVVGERGDAPDIMLVDDADEATPAQLVELVESWRHRHPSTTLVLAGRGRLLSLCGRDRRIEQRVRLRATLPTFTLAETRELLEPRLAAVDDEVLRTIHEIAGGIPATALRLADMVGVLSTSDPDRRLVVDDVETIHRRLSMHAA